MELTNNLQVPQRSSYWDNQKGILIFLVVLGHFTMAYEALRSITGGIYLFHMPAFLFISGYFSSKHTLQVTKIVRLCILFMGFNLILMVGSYGLHPENWNLYTVHLSAWYLLALILYRFTTPLLDHLGSTKSLILAATIGICTGAIPVRDSLCLYKILPLYPFFIAGFLFRQKNSLVPGHKNTKTTCLTVAILLITIFSGIMLMKTGVITFQQLLWIPYEHMREAVVRVYLYLVGFICIACLLYLTPAKRVPFLTTLGSNSLIIFVVHRPIVQLCDRFFPPEAWGSPKMWLLPGIAMVTLLTCNTKAVVRLFNSCIASVVHFVTKPKLNIASYALLFITLMVVLGGRKAYYTCLHGLKCTPDSPTQRDLRKMSLEQKKALNNCFKISYIGDLVFLSPQIHKAYHEETKTYKFDEVFKYTKDFFLKDDLTLAVLEGPVAESNYYSLTNCMDGKPIRLNYPDSLIDATKHAGIDFVTSATNHMLDHHLKGALETVQTLNEKGLPFVGTNTGPDQPRHRIVELKRDDDSTCRIAVLAYTYGSNYVPEADFFQPPLKNHISCLVAPDSPYYKQCLKQVKDDIQKAKAVHPDCLIIMPHMGEQFRHEPDGFQKHWCRIFVEEGADIILADHPHATQPIEWHSDATGMRNVLVVYCPGNYANSYTKDDGDAVSIVEIYIDKDSGKPAACAAIPMWVSSRGAYGLGQYIPIPIAPIVKGEIDMSLSNNDWERLKAVHPVITKSMLRCDIPLHAASLRYFSFPDKHDSVFRDEHEIKLSLSESARQSPIYQACIHSEHVCFVGDSITEGTLNMGYGWYEPLASVLPEHTRISEFSKGSMTSTYFLNHSNAIADIQADLYVMAYGTNDIRYRDPQVCAMTPQQYISIVSSTVDKIKKKNRAARFAFIAPWCSYIYDKNCQLPDDRKEELLTSYAKALKQWCEQEGHLFSNPNFIIREKFGLYHRTANPFWVDDTHPNGTTGTSLYASSVLENSGSQLHH